MNPNLTKLRPYPFERLRALLAQVSAPEGLRAIPMSIGEPRHAPPAFVLDALRNGLHTLSNYPATAGTIELRTACANWLQRRFNLLPNAINPETMVLPVNGTREALFALVQAAIDTQHDTKQTPLVVMPNPFYLIYEGASLLSGAEPYCMNANASNNFLPDLDAVPEDVWQRCQVLFLCSPGNPTGAVAPIAYLKRALELADKYDFIIASDECYSEIYLDESRPPPGLLEAAAQRDRFERCMVFHSLSKRSSLPGLRSGFVAGDPRLIKPFLLYRTYHGCAMPGPTQLASIPAWNDELHVIENRRLYRDKFAAVLPILDSVMTVSAPDAGFYLWAGVGDDEVFTRDLFAQQHVTVVPGSYLSRETPQGNPGKGRIRISLVPDVGECLAAAERIRAYAKSR